MMIIITILFLLGESNFIRGKQKFKGDACALGFLQIFRRMQVSLQSFLKNLDLVNRARDIRKNYDIQQIYLGVTWN